MVKSAEGKHLKGDASNYDSTAYEKPSVTVDIIICTIKDNKPNVLLIKRKHPPFKDRWALPGGFVEIGRGETLEDTAKRELKEETNLEGIHMEQLKTYGDPSRDPRMRIITVAYFSLIPWTKLNKQDLLEGDDAKATKYFPLENLPQLGFDHKDILDDLSARLGGKIWYTDIAFKILPRIFTWKNLQDIFEALLNKKLDTSNFRRKILKTFKIYEVKKMTPSTVFGRGRPSLNLCYEGMAKT